MSPTCNRGAGREGGSRDGDRIRGRPRQWGEGARPGPGGGEPRGEVLRRIAAAGSWRCGCGGGGRQVSRRPRRVRAWRPHGRPRGARPCSLLPPPCLSACLPPPSISLSLSLSLAFLGCERISPCFLLVSRVLRISSRFYGGFVSRRPNAPLLFDYIYTTRRCSLLWFYADEFFFQRYKAVRFLELFLSVCCC